MFECENCSVDHDGTYGSGRFCSAKCARGASTKGKRAEINKKVSQSLKERAAADPTFGFNDPKRYQEARASYDAKYDERVAALLATPFDDLPMSRKRERVAEEQGHRCNRCGLGSWLEKPLVLELEHRDGNPRNNTRENLEFLCPNCHSLTDTWRGKNVRSPGRKIVSDDDLIAALKSTKNIHQALGRVGLPQKGRSYMRAKRLLIYMLEHGG